MLPISKPKLRVVESKTTDPQSLLDWKWKKAKDHYERAYNVKFSKVPEKAQIEYLYQQIFKLGSDISAHLDRHPDLSDKIN